MSRRLFRGLGLERARSDFARVTTPGGTMRFKIGAHLSLRGPREILLQRASTTSFDRRSSGTEVSGRIS
jgi:hypothetical protein